MLSYCSFKMWVHLQINHPEVITIWLVVTGTCFICPHLGNNLIPTDELLFFGRLNHHPAIWGEIGVPIPVMPRTRGALPSLPGMVFSHGVPPVPRRGAWSSVGSECFGFSTGPLASMVFLEIFGPRNLKYIYLQLVDHVDLGVNIDK